MKLVSRISAEEIKGLKKEWSANFFRDRHGYTLRYLDGKVSFEIEYLDAFPEMLSADERSLFELREKSIRGKKEDVYTYCYGEYQKPQDTGIGFAQGYHLARPRFFREGAFESASFSPEELLAFLRSKKTCFYTGAGLSATEGVYSMDELMGALGIDLSVEVDSFIRNVLNSPHIPEKVFSGFCDKAFYGEPGHGHVLLTSLIQRFQIPVLTENFDLLHERSGILPYHTEQGTLRQDIDDDWLAELDGIVCIGLSFDDRGLLAYYKDVNPAGTLIALDKKKPSYIGREDYLVRGDLVESLRAMWSLVP